MAEGSRVTRHGAWLGETDLAPAKVPPLPDFTASSKWINSEVGSYINGPVYSTVVGCTLLSVEFEPITKFFFMLAAMQS